MLLFSNVLHVGIHITLLLYLVLIICLIAAVVLLFILVADAKTTSNNIGSSDPEQVNTALLVQTQNKSSAFGATSVLIINDDPENTLELSKVVVNNNTTLATASDSILPNGGQLELHLPNFDIMTAVSILPEKRDNWVKGTVSLRLVDTNSSVRTMIVSDTNWQNESIGFLFTLAATTTYVQQGIFFDQWEASLGALIILPNSLAFNTNNDDQQRHESDASQGSKITMSDHRITLSDTAGTDTVLLTGLSMAVADTDAASKAYVDSVIGGGSGDVTGPASSTNDGVVRFDGTTGKLIQDSSIIIDDSGNLTTSGDVHAASLKNSNGATSIDMSSLTNIAVTATDFTFNGQTVLTVGGGGSGDVTGPASSTNDGVVRFDGTTGKLIQDSSIIIDDSGNLTTSGDVHAASLKNSNGATSIDMSSLTNIAVTATDFTFNGQTVLTSTNILSFVSVNQASYVISGPLTANISVFGVEYTTTGACNITLPTVGDGEVYKVTVVDAAGNANTNSITITPTSGTINGEASATINVNHQSVTMIYSGTSGKWYII